ncbi:MAG: 5-formyltetrahydrofolate cyclo-ligase [Xanthomonadales bacterium]|nr:5-formyltetrahydrofolate cyclo-ligase [Xanthomonadales bacterium]
MNKTKIRQQLRLHRANINNNNRHQFNQNIIQHIYDSTIWQQAKSVAIYLPFGGEADISILSKADKMIYLPAIKGENMQFQIWNNQITFETLNYGLKQPTFVDGLNQDPIDLYLMPLVGFDSKGNRLGMGGGFYDRYFAESHKGVKAGVAYQCQQVEQLPSDPWDVKIQHIFTEQGHHEF